MNVNTKTVGNALAAAAITQASPSSGGIAQADPISPRRIRLCGLRERKSGGSGLGRWHGQDPVAVAASNNPLLTTLTAAVSGQLNPEVNLVDTLNGGEFTVIAPTDDAFAKLDPATIDKLKVDAPLLTKILTYHVIPGQLSPSQVVGKHKTVEGAEVTVTGKGEA